nr:unnamed protein product [Callosobruchus analis]
MDDSELPKLKRSNGNTISVNENPFIIGRALNCNYVIPNAQISRQHCSIEKIDGAWFLRDISTNGCYLNGTLVKKSSVPLSNNDIIGLCLDGSYDFSFQKSQSRDISISDEQLNMVADSLDTVFDQIEVSTVPNMEIPSVPVQEISTGSVTSTMAPFPICDDPTTNHEAISTVLNEIEVSTVPISEFSTVPFLELPVVLVPDSGPSPKKPRLEPSSSNTDNISNVLSGVAPLPICDNPGTSLQNATDASEGKLRYFVFIFIITFLAKRRFWEDE